MKEIKRFLKFLKPYWKKGLLAFFLMLISVLLQLPMPFLTRYIIDKVILLKSFKILNIIGFVLIGVIFLQSFSSFLENYLLTTFRARVLFDVRYKLYEHVQLLPLKFFHDKGTGYLMARISGDVDTLQGLLADTFIASVRNLLIFSGSIKENIRFGKPSATDEEIVESAKKSHAHDFIIKLPKGYDTEIGERGVKLSGGERQIK